MAYENLTGIFSDKQDGSLAIPNANDAPIVCVLGTAAQGNSESLFTVLRVADAASTFGKSGSLTRGMYETFSTGATNIRLFRIGATAAKLTLSSGAVIETASKDDSAGSDYSIWFIASSGRLRVYRNSDSTLVYDTGDGTANSQIDLGEVSVSGDGVAGGVNLGSSAATAVDLEDVTTTDTSGTFVAGTDGLNLNRMQTYEALQDAYDLLEDAELDIVVPMDVYLDDLNVLDATTATVSGLMATVSGHSDIVAGASNDYLGLLYEEEFEGKTYYFWDVDRDGVAEIVPTVEGISGSAQTTLNGGQHSIAAAVAGDSADLVSGSFHEVNFAYQLANFCFRQSHLNTEMTGVIGVKPPASFSAKDVSLWVGSRPTYTVVDGTNTISANGTGLLGNKWMAGRIASGTIPGHIIDGSAAPYGGFIATDDGYINGVQLKDNNEALVDIGKYIDVVSAWPQLTNPSRAATYSASGAAAYAGRRTTVRGASATTNKIISNVQLPFRLNNTKVDLLAGMRYVHFMQKRKGIVISDGVTAARPNSDYSRRSTMEIVRLAIDTVRDASEPFLGEGMSGAQLAALETVNNQQLGELVKTGDLQRFSLAVTATRADRIQGKATVQLVLVPAFELRQITVTVSLAAV